MKIPAALITPVPTHPLHDATTAAATNNLPHRADPMVQELPPNLPRAAPCQWDTCKATHSNTIPRRWHGKTFPVRPVHDRHDVHRTQKRCRCQHGKYTAVHGASTCPPYPQRRRTLYPPSFDGSMADVTFTSLEPSTDGHDRYPCTARVTISPTFTT